jgi:hypothetical protein
MVVAITHGYLYEKYMNTSLKTKVMINHLLLELVHNLSYLKNKY